MGSSPVGHDPVDLMTIGFEVAWAMGLIGGLARSGAFVTASPMFARTLPVPGRLALSLALGLALARPVVEEPTLGVLLSMVVSNVAIGLALAFLTGLLIHAFEMAGSIVDFMSGLSVAAVLDPITGAQTSVFGRTFNLAAGAVLFVSGADRVLITALDVTTRAVPLSGGLSFPTSAADYATETMSRLLFLAVQIALPAVGVIFLLELTLALGARLAPQANVFILGLPAKVAVAIFATGVVLTTLPNAADEVMRSFEDGFRALIGSPIGG